MFSTQQLMLTAALFVFANAVVQSPETAQKTFDQQGLVFDYAGSWEMSGQPNGDIQQLVLLEKTLDAQIMIIVPRTRITSAKQEEDAKHTFVEPAINRLLKQYDEAGIKTEQTSLSGEVAGTAAQGIQLRFSLDGQAGAADIYWLVTNQRLVQLIFVRPQRTASQSTPCWDLIRRTLKIRKS
jgi:hypothetical protein